MWGGGSIVGVIGGVLSSDAISWLPMCMNRMAAILRGTSEGLQKELDT